VSARIPVYVIRAGWHTIDAYREFLETDDLDELRVALTELGNALLRDPRSMLYAPEPLVEAWLTRQPGAVVAEQLADARAIGVVS